MKKVLILICFFSVSVTAKSQKINLSQINANLNIGKSPFKNGFYDNDGSNNILGFAEHSDSDFEIGLDCYINNSWAIGINTGECCFLSNDLELNRLMMTPEDFSEYYMSFYSSEYGYSINYFGFVLRKLVEFKNFKIEPSIDLSKIGGSMKYSYYGNIKRKGSHEKRHISFRTSEFRSYDRFMIIPSLKARHHLVEVAGNFVVGLSCQYKYFPRVHCSTKLTQVDEDLILGRKITSIEYFEKEISNHSFSVGFYIKVTPML